MLRLFLYAVASCAFFSVTLAQCLVSREHYSNPIVLDADGVIDLTSMPSLYTQRPFVAENVPRCCTGENALLYGGEIVSGISGKNLYVDIDKLLDSLLFASDCRKIVFFDILLYAFANEKEPYAYSTDGTIEYDSDFSVRWSFTLSPSVSESFAAFINNKYCEQHDLLYRRDTLVHSWRVNADSKNTLIRTDIQIDREGDRKEQIEHFFYFPYVLLGTIISRDQFHDFYDTIAFETYSTKEKYILSATPKKGYDNIVQRIRFLFDQSQTLKAIEVIGKSDNRMVLIIKGQTTPSDGALKPLQMQNMSLKPSRPSCLPQRLKTFHASSFRRLGSIRWDATWPRLNSAPMAGRRSVGKRGCPVPVW